MWRVLCLIGYSRPSRHQGGVALNPSGKTCGIVRFSGGGRPFGIDVRARTAANAFPM